MLAPAPSAAPVVRPTPLVDVDGRWLAHERLDVALAVAREFAFHHAAGRVVGPVTPEGVTVGPRGVTLEALPRVDGSPFVAPEVRAGAEATVASDVYALGALAFHLMGGRLPPPAFDAAALRSAEANGWSWVRPVRFAVAAEPEDRYPTAAAMVAELEALRHAGTRSRPSDPAPPPRAAPGVLHPVAQALLGGVTVAVCASAGAFGAFALMGALVAMAGLGARRIASPRVARRPG